MTIQILMPALSPTMTEGNLAKWHKKEGDTIVSGDVLAEIETDKATMEIESIDEGTLGKILVADGTEGVAVNTLIAVILEEDEDASALEAAVSAAPAVAPAAAAPAVAPAAAAPAAPAAPAPAPAAPQAAPQAVPQAAAPQAGGRIFASPLAKRLAEQGGLDLARVSGSGPHGRIVKRDVEAALAGAGLPGGALAPAASGAPAAMPQSAVPVALPGQNFIEIPNDNVRKIIAQRLTESKQTVPHFYLTADCRIDALLDMRKKLNAQSPEGEGAFKISVNDFVIRAVAFALRRVPEANASWAGDVIRQYTDVDISVAVATDKGLITPIVRHADTKGLAVISAEVKDLAARAREGALQPEEFQGGGFTISNLGMYGVKEFAAIINPPQSCILAVGAGEQRPVVTDGALAVATVMSCTLSVDHRSIDGAVGAKLLAAYKGFIEEPLTMML